MLKGFGFWVAAVFLHLLLSMRAGRDKKYGAVGSLEASAEHM